MDDVVHDGGRNLARRCIHCQNICFVSQQQSGRIYVVKTESWILPKGFKERNETASNINKLYLI